MNELALFAGGGGSILAGKLLGWRTVCAVEIDAGARKILFARQKDGLIEPFPVWDDINTFDGKPWQGEINIITAGFPCQDISIAGKGKGIKGDRSGLWSQAARVIGEVRPSIALIENSSAIFDRGFDRVLSDFTALGFNTRWGCFSAASAGACHKRERMFLLAYTDRKFLDCMDIQKPQSVDKEAAARQFARAIDAALPADDYASLPRDHDDVASRMDGLKATGNGWVPAVAARAFNTLANNRLWG